MIGTRKIINLCHQMKALEAFVYISTAYSNCDKLDIDEKIYSQSYTPNDLEAMFNIMPVETMNKVKFADTYTLVFSFLFMLIIYFVKYR